MFRMEIWELMFAVLLWVCCFISWHFLILWPHFAWNKKNLPASVPYTTMHPSWWDFILLWSHPPCFLFIHHLWNENISCVPLYAGSMGKVFCLSVLVDCFYCCVLRTLLVSSTVFMEVHSYDVTLTHEILSLNLWTVLEFLWLWGLLEMDYMHFTLWDWYVLWEKDYAIINEWEIYPQNYIFMALLIVNCVSLWKWLKF